MRRRAKETPPEPAAEPEPEITEAPEAEFVEIKVAFDRGGTLLKADAVEVAHMVQDEDFRAFATSAHEALAECGPFKLPADRYDIRRAFTMRFVPRQPS